MTQNFPKCKPKSSRSRFPLFSRPKSIKTFGLTAIGWTLSYGQIYATVEEWFFIFFYIMTIVYIDGANLYQGSKAWGGLDYKKLFQRFRDKYKPSTIYLFVGYVKGKESLYSHLSILGYTLIFKETLAIAGKTKGNVDAELVVQSMKDFYEVHHPKTILVTGDGDFSCLVNFLIEKNHPTIIVAPNRDYLSYLLKKTNVPIVFLEEQKHKIQKKAPTRDEL